MEEPAKVRLEGSGVLDEIGRRDGEHHHAGGRHERALPALGLHVGGGAEVPGIESISSAAASSSQYASGLARNAPKPVLRVTFHSGWGMGILWMSSRARASATDLIPALIPTSTADETALDDLRHELADVVQVLQQPARVDHRAGDRREGNARDDLCSGMRRVRSTRT